MLAATSTAPALHGRSRTIVVVGNGMVGARFCQLLRRRDAERRYRVVVFGDEPMPAYDRVRLSKLIVDGGDADLGIMPRSWWDEHAVELHCDAPVVAIEPEAKHVRTADGAIVGYDALVLATGAEPVLPPIPGTDADGVLVFRTAADASRLRERLSTANRVAVVGGGLLGLEAALGIRRRGLDVIVVEAAQHLMPRQLDSDGAALLAHVLDDRGIDVRIGQRLRAIERNDVGLTLRFETHDPATVDLVVMSVGVRPRDQLARRCGIAVGVRGGVIVSDELESSHPGVYAIGDCVCHRGEVPGLVSPGYAMARVLAERLTGGMSTFTGADSSCRLDLHGLHVSAVGDLTRGGREVSWQRGDQYRMLLLDGKRLVGARAVGEWPTLSGIERTIARGENVDDRALSRFSRTGDPWPPRLQQVSDWPASAVVCRCANVTRGELAEVITGGAASVAAVAHATRASSVCGSCMPLVAQLCGAPLAVPRERGLALLSIAALIACATIALVDPISFAESVNASDRWLSELWRDAGKKQLTGFVLLGAAVATLALSARKRIPWLRRGRYGAVRVFHAAVGVACAGLVVVHTGMHLGHNLNRWLMVALLAALATGGALGLAVALSGRTVGVGHLARMLRPAITWTHLVVLWALPVLVGFHIASVYYF